MPTNLQDQTNSRIVFWNRVYRVALLSLVAIIGIVVSFGVKQIYKTSEQIQNNGEGIIGYLDCVGHVKKPVTAKSQAEYDRCLDLMKKKVRGE